MRILITGFVVFVIWAIFSSWLYNDILLPVINKPVAVQPIPEPQNPVADSLAKIYASMPKTLLIGFEFDQAKFKTDPQTDSKIAEFKLWLDKYPASMLHVTGYTDLVGSTEYNLALSVKRAQVIAKYLETQGIISGRMVIDSRGEADPIADYITAEGRAKNRRTEISIKLQ
jgi:outer membrane protein OmpA-like peptidoglycan-associated protein